MKNFLDLIDVKSPCNENWDEMFGNDEVRFCSHCAKDVHNLSAMNRAEAQKLIEKSNGKLCVRYAKTPQGKLITAPPKLTQIKRRATIAASVLATSLTLSTLAYAQDEPMVKKDNSAQTQNEKLKKDEVKKGLATVCGEIKDTQGAVISGAYVTLRDTKSTNYSATKTTDLGIYEYKNVEPNTYELTIESPGFKKLVMKNLEILKDVKLEKNFVLEASEVVGGLAIIVEDLIETSEPKLEEKVIEQRPLLQLPQNTQIITTGYLMELPNTIRNSSDLLKVAPIKQTEYPPKTNPKKKKN